MKNLIALVLIGLTLSGYQSVRAQVKKPQGVIVASPDGMIKLNIENKGGLLLYSVSYRSKQVIEPSGLGLIVNDKEIGSNATIGTTTNTSANSTYSFRGVHSVAVNHYNGASTSLNSNGQKLTLETRVFNNGVAFRYVVNVSGTSVISKDLTSFIIPAGSAIWSQNNIKAYEGKYTKKNAEDFKKGELLGPPATIELPGNLGYAAITEGGLVDFAGMSLIADSNRVFKANLTGNTNKTGVISTPWRIVEIGADLNTLVNCDIIANVSPPMDPKLFPNGYNTDWVKPGRSVWSWLAVKRSITLDNMKAFTDLAAQLGFEYNLVDEGWGKWKDSTRDNMAMMKELVDYSTPKGVKIWVWKAYPDRAGIPGIKDSTKMVAFFEQCKKIGVAGLKIDFFDSEGQEVIDFYQAALKEAARLHLMLDFHGADKPAGQSRTWPNEMSREGVRGMENQPPWAPANTVIPFTRYLAGPGDFTPMHFGNRLGEISWAQHVASMVIYTSPFLCLGADPQSILDNSCRDMIKSIPPTWDETIVLPQSKIGELALFARRKGDTWFIAAMSASPQPKTINIDLSFLKIGKYQLSSVKDDAQKQAGAVLETSTIVGKSLTINLNATGGFVGRLKKVD